MNGVWGTVNYLAPGSARNRLYVAPGEQRSTARYEPRQVFVGDGRACRDDLTFDAAGFTLVDHVTSVPPCLDNPAVLDGAYTGEGVNVVRALTGADYVVSLGWMMRRTAADRRGALPPAPDVHVDLHTTEIAHRYARVHARSPLPAPGTYRRAVWTSLWRAFSPPPQDWPLAVCDYRSTDDEDGTPNLLFRVPVLPALDAQDAPDDEAESAASLFFYNAAHRWWYFPGMHAGEALLVKLHDTDHSVAWRAPHTSFLDHAADGAHPRESVELRTVAYYR